MVEEQSFKTKPGTHESPALDAAAEGKENSMDDIKHQGMSVESEIVWISGIELEVHRLKECLNLLIEIVCRETLSGPCVVTEEEFKELGWDPVTKRMLTGTKEVRMPDDG